MKHCFRFDAIANVTSLTKQNTIKETVTYFFSLAYLSVNSSSQLVAIQRNDISWIFVGCSDHKTAVKKNFIRCPVLTLLLSGYSLAVSDHKTAVKKNFIRCPVLTLLTRLSGR